MRHACQECSKLLARWCIHWHGKLGWPITSRAHCAAGDLPKVPDELSPPTMRTCASTMRSHAAGSMLQRNHSQLTQPRSDTAEPGHLSAYDGAHGYLQAMRSVRTARRRSTPQKRSKSIVDSLPPDLQHTAAHLYGTLERIRSLPVSEHRRCPKQPVDPGRVAVFSQTGRNAMRGGSVIPGLRRELCDAGPAFAEFCRLQEEQWERQQQRQAAAAAAAQPVLRSESLALQLDPSPPPPAPPLQARGQASTTSQRQLQTSCTQCASADGRLELHDLVCVVYPHRASSTCTCRM